MDIVGAHSRIEITETLMITGELTAPPTYSTRQDIPHLKSGGVLTMDADSLVLCTGTPSDLHQGFLRIIKQPH